MRFLWLFNLTFFIFVTILQLNAAQPDIPEGSNLRQAVISREASFQMGLDADEQENYPEAKRHYLRAANQGHMDAQFNAADLLGAEQNLPAAEQYYKLAAFQGHPDAYFYLAELMQRHGYYVEAIRYYFHVGINHTKTQHELEILLLNKKIALNALGQFSYDALLGDDSAHQIVQFIHSNYVKIYIK